jgi:hypothetical protein
MASSGMLRRVALVTTDVSEELSDSFMALVTTDVSEELSASFIRVTRIC